MKKIILGLLLCAVVTLVINFALEHLTLEKTGHAFEETQNLTQNSKLPLTNLMTDSDNRPLKKNILRPSPDFNQDEAVRADQKVKVLREILTSKNDNDPRLDNEFQNLTEIEKERLRQEYKSMPRESFNDKGTVIYLLGRNLKTSQDVHFLAEVLSEAPCANMADCAKPAPAMDSAALHETAVDQITLAYPQIVSLKSLEPYIVAPPTDPQMKQSVFEALRSGSNSKNNVVSKMARDYTKKYLVGNGG